MTTYLRRMESIEPRQSPPCTHALLVCLNQHELVRKYRCKDCGAVMMCACDEAIGKRFLSHQLDQGCELDTQRRVPVTHGFQPATCSECRGLPADCAPAGEIHGRTSKIKRYYWRELFFAEMARKADWREAHPAATADERAAAEAEIDAEVLNEIKARHAKTPKYFISEPSQAEVLTTYGVEVLAFAAEYVEAPRKGAVIRDGEETISAETFVTRHFEASGWSVLPLESVPFHCLFGVMMWLLMQDPSDERVRVVGFGERSAYEADLPMRQIWTYLPDDFGTAGYGARRQGAIDEHLALIGMGENLLPLFDGWRDPSHDLRQYLWAHRAPDVDRARRLVQILPSSVILKILRYLAGDYWGRYLGWPDLLIHRDDEFLLVEVKSSGDKLSQGQRHWIADNHDRLQLPFKVAKIHRANRKGASAT